jgi:integrase-like protein
MAQINPLCRRMIDDMTIRNLSPSTQEAYVSAVRRLGKFFNRSPDKLTVEDIRKYQVHLARREQAWGSLNKTVCALRLQANHCRAVDHTLKRSITTKPISIHPTPLRVTNGVACSGSFIAQEPDKIIRQAVAGCGGDTLILQGSFLTRYSIWAISRVRFLRSFILCPRLLPRLRLPLRFERSPLQSRPGWDRFCQLI